MLIQIFIFTAYVRSPPTHMFATIGHAYIVNIYIRANIQVFHSKEKLHHTAVFPPEFCFE